jgi:sensor domain CHASE-containing protein
MVGDRRPVATGGGVRFHGVLAGVCVVSQRFQSVSKKPD